MIFTRQMLEAIEEEKLAPYGIRSKDIRGRAYPDKEPEYRTSFQETGTAFAHHRFPPTGI
jgi:hypothetical protein